MPGKTKTMPPSNLECFLYCTTPRVPAHVLPEASVGFSNGQWLPHELNTIQYFNLSDLWDCYDEWSAYGVGSPIYNGGETVVQYYTPYLSALQIFTVNDSIMRETSDDCDNMVESKSWSTKSEVGRLPNSISTDFDQMWEMEDISNGFMSYQPIRDRFGKLYVEYFERDGPFGRVPLKSKVDLLSRRSPQLKLLSSLDLSPASWMAIGWYPIYPIPPQRKAKDLYASFLTYHTLSSSFQDNMFEETCSDSYYNGLGKTETQSKGECKKISLHPFGLATYKMQPKIWLNPETTDFQRISSLTCAADSWLKQLHVHHPDFRFFSSHVM